MGNCLKCFQVSAPSDDDDDDANIATNIATVNTPLRHEDIRKIVKKDETTETAAELLLSQRSPFKKNANHCDTKRNSFKSLVLLNGNTTTMNNIIATVKETVSVSDNTLNQLFEKYKDPDEEDLILADGIERFCRDLNYLPDEFAILVLAWRLTASQMCRFTKAEFIEGLQRMNADTIETIRLRLEQQIEMLKIDAEMFKQLYKFTFRFGLEPDQRILPLDMAICLWKLVFTVRTPPLLNDWIHFLEQDNNKRGIPKDTWNMFLNFSEQCDIETYDDTEAWPSLFDDFVEYERARMEAAALDNNNATTEIVFQQ